MSNTKQDNPVITEKKKFDLYVKGNIICRGYMATNGIGYLGQIPIEEVDLQHGIIIEGDVTVDSICVFNGRVACSGHASMVVPK